MTFHNFREMKPATVGALTSVARTVVIMQRFGQANPQGWGLAATATDDNRPAVAAVAISERSAGPMQGTIKKIDKARVFGFIRGDDGADYFFHKSGMAKGVEFNELAEGQAVKFEPGEGAKGPRAEEIERA